MIIGSHELKGNVQILAQPLVLLKKGSKTEKDPVDNKKRKSKSDDSSANEDEREYIVAGVVRKKILFNSYPKIIIR